MLGHVPRGVAPGWHASRRWRFIVAEFSNGENRYEAIYEIASTIAGLKQLFHLSAKRSAGVKREPMVNS